MIDDEKRAEEWAYTQVAKLVKEGVIPSVAGTLEIAEYSYAAGVRAERERLTEKLKIAEEKGARSMLKYLTSHYAVNKVATDAEVFKFWRDGK